MATLPMQLPVGTVSIYNAGASVNEIFSPTDNEFIRFGVVEQTYNQFGVASRGTSVMFDLRYATPLFYIDQQYYIVPENKIGGVEIIAPPAP